MKHLPLDESKTKRHVTVIQYIVKSLIVNTSTKRSEIHVNHETKSMGHLYEMF